MEIDAGLESTALFELIKKRFCCDQAVMDLKQYDVDIEKWVGVDGEEVEVVDGAKFQVTKEVPKIPT